MSGQGESDVYGVRGLGGLSVRVPGVCTESTRLQSHLMEQLFMFLHGKLSRQQNGKYPEEVFRLYVIM